MVEEKKEAIARGKEVPIYSTKKQVCNRYDKDANCTKYNIKCLGYFENEEDAARAYDRRAKKLFKEFANLNFKD